jgi:hypothetical protein
MVCKLTLTALKRFKQFHRNIRKVKNKRNSLDELFEKQNKTLKRFQLMKSPKKQNFNLERVEVPDE